VGAVLRSCLFQIGILGKRIKYERSLRLIRKFLNAGYLENWKYNNTYSGTLQGGIISPILANIYLDKFDKGKRRKENPIAKQLGHCKA
jgi:retron-type reverse transcriptase